MDLPFQILFKLFWAEVGVMILWIVGSLLTAIYRLAIRRKTALSYFHPAYMASTCFGLGKIPFISGTWGSLFAINLLVAITILPRMSLIYQNTIFWLIAGATLLSSIGGIKAADIYARRIIKANITGQSIANDVKSVMIGMLISVGIAVILYKYDAQLFPFYEYFAGNIYFWGLLVITLAFCVRRILRAEKYAQKMDKSDPSAVIIDEVSGQFITVSIIIPFLGGLYLYDYDTFRPLLFLMPFYIVICFLLFRFFDIIKPCIIGRLDRELKGGIGIMADDMVAGVFAALTFIALFLAMHFSGGFFWFYSEFLPEWLGTPPIKGVIQ